ncbi:hypothetical protein FHS96_003740 [Sphingomonas zeicaulis]|uniref:hypothetical protein n=1 Tax=Sphingomonas zeicaulis TaxID=1632740 RepID=UPI003D262895
MTDEPFVYRGLDPDTVISKADAHRLALKLIDEIAEPEPYMQALLKATAGGVPEMHAMWKGVDRALSEIRPRPH